MDHTIPGDRSQTVGRERLQNLSDQTKAVEAPRQQPRLSGDMAAGMSAIIQQQVGLNRMALDTVDKGVNTQTSSAKSVHATIKGKENSPMKKE